MANGLTAIMVTVLKLRETPVHHAVPQDLTGFRSTVLQKQTHSWKKRPCLWLPEADVREGGDQMRAVKRYKPAVIKYMQNGEKNLKRSQNSRGPLLGLPSDRRSRQAGILAWSSRSGLGPLVFSHDLIYPVTHGGLPRWPQR